jgi:predicted RNase H-like HicB family nuclease
VKFEVEVTRTEAGQWCATAVEHGVSATGQTEKEALVRLLEALATHFKKPAGT